MTLDYEGYLKLIDESNETEDESNEFLFSQDICLNYEVKKTEKEELCLLIEKYFSSEGITNKQTRSKLCLKKLNRRNAYFKAKALRLSKDRDLAYLKDLEKEALLEHILILEYAFDFAMNALEEKNKGNYYEF